MYMQEVRNLNGKRVGDISEDGRIFLIRQKDCFIKISANSDGTLQILSTRNDMAA